jgi:endonuclease/exonuclease/phosphatase family metal-dependent hydrolase
MKRIIICFIVLSWMFSISATADTLSKSPNHVYIASFNTYLLGTIEDKYKDIKDWKTPVDDTIPQRIADLAKVIAVGGFHIVAIQEVRSGPGGYFAIKDLKRALKNNHNMYYRFFISDYIGRGYQISEAMAFMYRPHKAKYIKIDDERSVLIKIPGRDLVKTQWICNNFDFTMISAHLAWGNETKRDAGYKKIKDIFDNPSNYSDDEDIIVLGDFNRFGKEFDSVKELTHDSLKFLAPNVTFFDPDFNMIEQVTPESIQGKEVPDDNPQLISTTVAPNKFVYDMFLISADTAEEFPPGSNEAEYEKDFGIIHFDEPEGFGFQSGTDTMGHDSLKKAYSDHRPIWMRFKTNTNNYDGTWD